MEYHYITSKALLVSSNIKFTEVDYRTIGERMAEAYFKKYNEKAKLVMTVNSKKRKTKACSLYPIDFLPVMEEIIFNHFTEPKR